MPPGQPRQRSPALTSAAGELVKQAGGVGARAVLAAIGGQQDGVGEGAADGNQEGRSGAVGGQRVALLHDARGGRGAAVSRRAAGSRGCTATPALLCLQADRVAAKTRRRPAANPPHREHAAVCAATTQPNWVAEQGGAVCELHGELSGLGRGQSRQQGEQQEAGDLHGGEGCAGESREGRSEASRGKPS